MSNSDTRTTCDENTSGFHRLHTDFCLMTDIARHVRARCRLGATTVALPFWTPGPPLIYQALQHMLLRLLRQPHTTYYVQEHAGPETKEVEGYNISSLECVRYVDPTQRETQVSRGLHAAASSTRTCWTRRPEYRNNPPRKQSPDDTPCVWHGLVPNTQ